MSPAPNWLNLDIGKFGLLKREMRASWLEAEVSILRRSNILVESLYALALVGVFVFFPIGCVPTNLQTAPQEKPSQKSGETLTYLLSPNPEDIPFFEAIADEQDKKLQQCPSDDECLSAHFLRGLAALYTNQKVAAHHFRRVVAAKPNSQLASESRFWLWVLEVQKAPEESSPSSRDMAKRLAREMVDRELIVHELVSKLDNSSVEALQEDLNHREKTIEELNLKMASLTKQLEQLKKEVVVRQGLQQELKASERKVQELVSQLEALRRIDQELKEKTPPTRPSEKMTPSPEVETESIQEKKNTHGG